jgi:hypothetical protein
MVHVIGSWQVEFFQVWGKATPSVASHSPQVRGAWHVASRHTWMCMGAGIGAGKAVSVPDSVPERVGVISAFRSQPVIKQTKINNIPDNNHGYFIRFTP